MLSERIERWSKELRAEGMAEGELKGRTEGMAEGELKGRAEGELKGRADVAKKMLQKGIPVKEISEITGLSEEEIVELKRPSII